MNGKVFEMVTMTSEPKASVPESSGVIEQFKEECDKLNQVVDIQDVNINNLIDLWIQFKHGLHETSNGLTEVDSRLEPLLICTSKLLFNVKYSTQISKTCKQRLKEEVLLCGETLTEKRKKLCLGIGSFVEDPWGNSVFNKATGVSNPRNDESSNMLWENEGWIMLETRIDYLARVGKTQSKRISNVLRILIEKGHDNFESHETTSSNSSSPHFDPYVYSYKKYVEYLEGFVVLNFVDQDAMMFDTWSKHVLLDVISSLRDKVANRVTPRLFPKFKVWKNAGVAAKFLAQRASWRALKSDGILVEKFFVIWVELSKEESQESPFDEILKDHEEISETEYIYKIANFVIQTMGKTEFTRSRFVELFILGMQKDINIIENLKNAREDKSDQIKRFDRQLSLRYLDLAVFFKEFPKTAHNCLLTAFSLNPCTKLFNLLFPQIENDPDSISLQVSDEGNIAIPSDYDQLQRIDFEQGDLKLTDDLGLVPLDIRDSLDIVIQNPRYKGFLGLSSKDELKDKCRMLLDSKSVSNIENKVLDHLEVDYEKYKDLKPQYDPDDDGIEKGYRMGERLRRYGIRAVNRNQMPRPRPFLKESSSSKAKKNALKRVRTKVTAKDLDTAAICLGRPRKGRPSKLRILSGEFLTENLSKPIKCADSKPRMPNICLPNDPWTSADSEAGFFRAFYSVCLHPQDPLYKERNFRKYDESSVLKSVESMHWQISRETEDKENKASNNGLQPTGNATPTISDRIDQTRYGVSNMNSFYDGPCRTSLTTTLYNYQFSNFITYDNPRNPVKVKSFHIKQSEQNTKNENGRNKEVRFGKESTRFTKNSMKSPILKIEKLSKHIINAATKSRDARNMVDTDNVMEEKLKTSTSLSATEEPCINVPSPSSIPTPLLPPPPPPEPVFAGAFQIMGIYTKDKTDGMDSQCPTLPVNPIPTQDKTVSNLSSQCDIVNKPIADEPIQTPSTQAIRNQDIHMDVSSRQPFPVHLSNTFLANAKPEPSTAVKPLKTYSSSTKRRLVITRNWDMSYGSKKMKFEEYKSSVPTETTTNKSITPIQTQENSAEVTSNSTEINSANPPLLKNCHVAVTAAIDKMTFGVSNHPQCNSSNDYTNPHSSNLEDHPKITLVENPGEIAMDVVEELSREDELDPRVDLSLCDEQHLKANAVDDAQNLSRSTHLGNGQDGFVNSVENEQLAVGINLTFGSSENSLCNDSSSKKVPDSSGIQHKSIIANGTVHLPHGAECTHIQTLITKKPVLHNEKTVLLSPPRPSANPSIQETYQRHVGCEKVASLTIPNENSSTCSLELGGNKQGNEEVAKEHHVKDDLTLTVNPIPVFGFDGSESTSMQHTSSSIEPQRQIIAFVPSINQSQSQEASKSLSVSSNGLLGDYENKISENGANNSTAQSCARIVIEGSANKDENGRTKHDVLNEKVSLEDKTCNVGRSSTNHVDDADSAAHPNDSDLDSARQTIEFILTKLDGRQTCAEILCCDDTLQVESSDKDGKVPQDPEPSTVPNNYISAGSSQTPSSFQTVELISASPVETLRKVIDSEAKNNIDSVEPAHQCFPMREDQLSQSNFQPKACMSSSLVEEQHKPIDKEIQRSCEPKSQFSPVSIQHVADSDDDDIICLDDNYLDTRARNSYRICKEDESQKIENVQESMRQQDVKELEGIINAKFKRPSKVERKMLEEEPPIRLAPSVIDFVERHNGWPLKKLVMGVVNLDRLSPKQYPERMRHIYSTPVKRSKRINGIKNRTVDLIKSLKSSSESTSDVEVIGEYTNTSTVTLPSTKGTIHLHMKRRLTDSGPATVKVNIAVASISAPKRMKLSNGTHEILKNHEKSGLKEHPLHSACVSGTSTVFEDDSNKSVSTEIVSQDYSFEEQDDEIVTLDDDSDPLALNGDIAPTEFNLNENSNGQLPVHMINSDSQSEDTNESGFSTEMMYNAESDTVTHMYSQAGYKKDSMLSFVNSQEFTVDVGGDDSSDIEIIGEIPKERPKIRGIMESSKAEIKRKTHSSRFTPEKSTNISSSSFSPDDRLDPRNPVDNCDGKISDSDSTLRCDSSNQGQLPVTDGSIDSCLNLYILPDAGTVENPDINANSANETGSETVFDGIDTLSCDVSETTLSSDHDKCGEDQSARAELGNSEEHNVQNVANRIQCEIKESVSAIIANTSDKSKLQDNELDPTNEQIDVIDVEDNFSLVLESDKQHQLINLNNELSSPSELNIEFHSENENVRQRPTIEVSDSTISENMEDISTVTSMEVARALSKQCQSDADNDHITNPDVVEVACTKKMMAPDSVAGNEIDLRLEDSPSDLEQAKGFNVESDSTNSACDEDSLIVLKDINASNSNLNFKDDTITEQSVCMDVDAVELPSNVNSGDASSIGQDTVMCAEDEDSVISDESDNDDGLVSDATLIGKADIEDENMEEPSPVFSPISSQVPDHLEYDGEIPETNEEPDNNEDFIEMLEDIRECDNEIREMPESKKESDNEEFSEMPVLTPFASHEDNRSWNSEDDPLPCLILCKEDKV